MIKKVELKGYPRKFQHRYPELKIRIITGLRTYIRSFARDIGINLGTGAYLKKLEMTRVGDFTKEESLIIDEFYKKAKRKQLSPDN